MPDVRDCMGEAVFVHGTGAEPEQYGMAVIAAEAVGRVLFVERTQTGARVGQCRNATGVPTVGSFRRWRRASVRGRGMSPSIVDIAMEIAASGLPVFPCAGDERPIIKNGFFDATTNPDIVRKLFSRPSAQLIGVPTGPAAAWIFWTSITGMALMSGNRRTSVAFLKLELMPLRAGDGT